MSIDGFSVILPCAGSGTRLGIKTPKELLEIEPGCPLITYSLDLLCAIPSSSGSKIRVIVIIRDGKESVVDFVRNYLDPETFEVIAVYFDTRFEEWPGSVYSAKSYFQTFNLVLLPDSYLVLSKRDRFHHETQFGGLTLIDATHFALQSSPLVFGVKETQQAGEMKRLGAVSLIPKQKIISGFADKPHDPSAYNGIWGCFAFRADIADELHAFLMASVRHQNNQYLQRSFYPAHYFSIADYQDLGTWEQIECFRKKES